MPDTRPLELPPAFHQRYRAYVERVEAALEAVLPPPDRWPDVLHEALRYSVFSGGKRLRPVLVLAAAELCGGRIERALPAACAVELVHTYSLVHDDLPCMDDDAFRRGRPTTHVVYGEAMAVLAGDALLTLAFACLTDPASPLEPAVQAAMVRELAVAAGSTGLVAGQVADLAAERREEWRTPVPRAGDAAGEVERIHRHKTGALFGACVRLGALSAGGDAKAMARLSRFAEDFGLAFQIVDDILDVSGQEQATGRPLGSDERRGKTTFVSVFGLETARRQARAAIERACEALAAFGEKADFLRDLAAYVLLRQG